MKKYILGFLVISGIIIFAAVPVPQLTRRSSAGGSTNVLETALTTNNLSSLSANSLLGLNGSKQLFNPNISTGLLFSGGALSASGVQLSAFNSAQFDTNGGNISLLSGAAGPTYTNLTVVSNAYFTTTYHTLINAVTALITNLNYVTGKGNVLNITNSIKLGDYYVYPIQAGNGISLSTNASPTSGTNVTVTVTNVTEAQLLLAANTTGNASTTKHGFVPILPNDATKYYDGSGAYSIPAGTFTFSVNGTNTTTPNVQDSATITWAKNGSNFIASAASSSGGTPGFTISSSFIMANQTNLDGGTLGTNASMIIGGSSIARTNGDNLLSAYAWAKTATPHSSAKAANNHFTIFLLPGTYDLGSGTLTMDTAYIDVIGLSRNTGQIKYVAAWTDRGDTLVTSSGDVFKVTTATATAPMTIANLCLETTGASTFAFRSTVDMGDGFRLINVLIRASTLSVSKEPMSYTGVDYGGYYEDVRCWYENSFSGADANKAASGTFIRCKAGPYSFGATASGVFIECEADGCSFGRTACSGNFYRCRGVTINGTGCAFFGDNGTMSGVIYDTDTSVFGQSIGTGAGGITGSIYNSSATSFGTVATTAIMANCTATSAGTSYNTSRIKSQAKLDTPGTLFIVGGTLKVNTTTTGNIGGGEDNLITYSVPGGQLSVNGDYLEFDCAGTFNNSTHNKQLKVYFGATAIFDTGSLSGATLGASSWRAHGKIVRTGAATQKATTEFTLSGALLGALTTTTTTYTTAAETLSSASTFKCTGTDLDATPSNNEVVQEIEVLKWYPNN